jgi:hypothetical protein
MLASFKVPSDKSGHSGLNLATTVFQFIILSDYHPIINFMLSKLLTPSLTTS